MPTEFTLDINIIMIGTGMSDRKPTACHQEFLRSFDSKSFLVMDTSSHIITLYDQKLGSFSSGKIWLTNILQKGRVKLYSLKNLPRQLTVKLKEHHFDPDDVKFVRMAYSSDSKLLVTEEQGFGARVRTTLRRFANVVVCDACDARDSCDCKVQIEIAG